MPTRTLFLAGVLVAAACTHGGPVLEQPIGQTMGPRSPAQVPPTATTTDEHSSDNASNEDASSDAGANGTNDVQPTAAADGADPCRGDLPVIAFGGASTTIGEQQEQALRRLAECLHTPSFAQEGVVLIGYTDLMGTVDGNLQLGLVRAQAVLKHLVSNGVAPARIVVASAGELQRPSARMGLHAPRVEVLLTRGGPTRPNEAPINRGIDAQGLMPRPPKPPSPAPPARATSTARPSPRTR